MLTPKQVAGILNESLASTYRRLDRGDLTTVRLSGGHGPLRVPRDELERFLTRNAQP